MGEEVIKEGEGNKPVEDIKEPSPIEQEALDMGWRPKEEWSGPEDDFIDARTFVRNKSLFDKIESLSKRVKDQDRTIGMLKDHHSKVEEATRKQVILELKKAKKQALEEDNLDLSIEIDDEIAKQRAMELYEKEQTKKEQPLHPDFVAWVEKNSWYAKDKTLRGQADALGMAYKQSNPEKDPDEVLKYVVTQVKKLNPEKFTNPERSKPSMVEGSSSKRTPTTGKEASFQLTEDEEKVCKTFVRSGVMSREDYIKEIKKIRGDN